MKRAEVLQVLKDAGVDKIDGKPIHQCKNAELLAELKRITDQQEIAKAKQYKIRKAKVFMRKPKPDSVRYIYGIDVWNKDVFEVPRGRVKWLQEFGYEVVEEQ